jgi:hypothetical protein
MLRTLGFTSVCVRYPRNVGLLWLIHTTKFRHHAKERILARMKQICMYIDFDWALLETT